MRQILFGRSWLDPAHGMACGACRAAGPRPAGVLSGGDAGPHGGWSAGKPREAARRPDPGRSGPPALAMGTAGGGSVPWHHARMSMRRLKEFDASRLARLRPRPTWRLRCHGLPPPPALLDRKSAMPHHAMACAPPCPPRPLPRPQSRASTLARRDSRPCHGFVAALRLPRPSPAGARSRSRRATPWRAASASREHGPRTGVQRRSLYSTEAACRALGSRHPGPPKEASRRFQALPPPSGRFRGPPPGGSVEDAGLVGGDHVLDVDEGVLAPVDLEELLRARAGRGAAGHDWYYR